jgi:hypothetical protein
MLELLLAGLPKLKADPGANSRGLPLPPGGNQQVSSAMQPAAA